MDGLTLEPRPRCFFAELLSSTRIGIGTGISTCSRDGYIYGLVWFHLVWFGEKALETKNTTW